MKYTKLKLILATAAALSFAACGKKKTEDASKPQAKIAYAIYQLGVYDTTTAKKASEWLNRAEMVTVLETVKAPDPKNEGKTKEMAKIERTTGKQGYVDAASLESKAFVVIGALEVFNVNQASAKKLATVPAGHVGFVVEEKGDWVKVRFGYKVNEKWNNAADSLKWVDQKWAQLSAVSYDPAAIGQGIELENAMRKYLDADAAKKAAGKKELEAIVNDGKSQFVSVAKDALSAEASAEKPAENKPAETKPAEGKPAGEN
ncbi:MAG: hypothetical protein JNJ69_17805 [Leptospiraceae bacterium]|nr:hypothetical protein [Leptospiraceae bacterium]